MHILYTIYYVTKFYHINLFYHRFFFTYVFVYINLAWPGQYNIGKRRCPTTKGGVGCTHPNSSTRVPTSSVQTTPGLLWGGSHCQYEC